MRVRVRVLMEEEACPIVRGFGIINWVVVVVVVWAGGWSLVWISRCSGREGLPTL